MKLFRKDIKKLPDEALVQLLSSARSNEALTELHARYSKKVLGFFIRMFNRDEEKAQDFTQDLFIRILEKHHLFDPQKRFYTWMFTIASNMAKTSFRKKSDAQLSEDGYELIDRTTLTDSGFDKQIFRDLLSKAIERLEDHHRLTFTLRYINEMSIRDISEVTETSIGTVKSRLFYATKKISKDLAEFDPGTDQQIFKIG